MSESNFRKAIEILESGRELTDGRYRYALSEDNELCMIATKEADGKTSEVLLSVNDWPFSAVYKTLNEIDNEQLMLKLAEIAVDRDRRLQAAKRSVGLS